MARFAMDLSPLRSSRDFRLMFWARVIALLGISLTLVGLSVQVYQLTGSSFAVAMVNAAAGVTLFAGTLVGGVMADRLERRQLLVISRGGAAVVFAVLAGNAILDVPQLWVVYVCSAVIGIVDGVGETALSAVTPSLVRRDQLAAAGALTAITTQLATMVGPTIGGILIAGPGVAVCYGITCAATVVQVVMMSRIARRPPADIEHQHPIKAMAEGWRFVRRHQVIAGLLLVDLCGGLFALPYAVFPEMAERALLGDPRIVGMLYSAPAVGAFLGALFSGWLGRLKRPGYALTPAGMVWGLGMLGFGLAGNLPFALVFLGLAGLGMIFADILQRALLQNYTPDRLMGRVSSFWLVQATVGPAIGGTFAGTLAAHGGARFAVITGGLLCTSLVVLIPVLLPKFRNSRLTQADNSDEPDVVVTAET